MAPFALVLMPDDAGLLVSGWAADAWLVACVDEAGRRWEAALESDLPGLVGRLPVWPPLDGFIVADLSAEDELALLHHLAAVPGLADAAAARFGSEPPGIEELPSASDIDWDE